MKFQPLNLLYQRSPFIAIQDGTSYEKCPGNLTIFDIAKIPNFYIFLEDEILSNDFDVRFIDVNGFTAHNENVPASTIKKANVEGGVYYFFYDIDSNFASPGIYQISVGYTAQDTNDYFEIFDYHKFVDTPEDCLYKMSFSQGCNIGKIPFIRCPEFKFEFYFSEESGYFRETPVYEAEYEDNKENQDEAVFRRMVLQQQFRALNITEALFHSIVYGAIYNNYEISINGETNEKIRNIQFENPTYEGCCIFSFTINIIRDYEVNTGCCSDIILTDCFDYQMQEVESVQDDLLEPFSDNNLCWLIEDDISNTPTEWSSHFNEVACGNGDGTWTYSQPDRIYIKDTNSYKVFNGTTYQNSMLITSVISVPPSTPIPGLYQFQVQGLSFEGYEACVFRSFNGQGYDPDDTTLIGTYSQAQFEGGFTFQVQNCPFVGCGAPDSMNLSVLFKKPGCQDIYNEFFFPIPF